MNRGLWVVILGLGMSALLSGCSWTPVTEYDGKIMRGRVEDLASKNHQRQKIEKGWEERIESDLKGMGIQISREQFIDEYRGAWIVIHRRLRILAYWAYIPPGLDVQVNDIVDFRWESPPYASDWNKARVIKIVCKHDDEACIAKKGKRGIVLQPDNPDSPIDTL